MVVVKQLRANNSLKPTMLSSHFLKIFSFLSDSGQYSFRCDSRIAA